MHNAYCLLQHPPLLYKPYILSGAPRLHPQQLQSYKNQDNKSTPFLYNSTSRAMCRVMRELYECSHYGARICLKECDFGFDFSTGKKRCEAEDDYVWETYFERNSRCVKCRWDNRPRNSCDEERRYHPQAFESHEHHLAARRRNRAENRLRRLYD